MGLTQFTTKEQLCRAALEAICFQTREILDAMQSDSKYELSSLLVDGCTCRHEFIFAKDLVPFLFFLYSYVTEQPFNANAGRSVWDSSLKVHGRDHGTWCCNSR